MNFFHSIKFKFTIWYLIVLGILLLLLSTGVYYYLSYTLHQNLDEELKLRSRQLVNMRDIVLIVGEGQFEFEIGEVILFYYHSGKELVSMSPTDREIPVSEKIINQVISGQRVFYNVTTGDGVELRVFAVPFKPPDPRLSPRPPPRPGELANNVRVNPEALVIGRPTKDINEALDGLLRTFFIAVPITMLLAGGGGIFLARRVFKPVEQITRTAREIEGTDLSKRINVKSRDELGRLAATINQMIERLEKAFERQQQFTSDASHELRTPLAVIQAESTLALQKKRTTTNYRKSLDIIAQESDHMADIIQQLLTLARADSGIEQLTIESIDLGDLLGNLKYEMNEFCLQKSIKFQLIIKENINVPGDKTWLRQLFRNLTDNAIRYTSEQGSITVSLYQEPQMAVVSVLDSGIGIPAGDIPHIFERFYRVDKARSRAEGGSGLGLAICQFIAKAHDGRIDVDSQIGKGSSFTVWLPL